jgi:hypothetical protein
VDDCPRTVFGYTCRLGAEGIVSKKVDGAYRSGHAASGSRSATRQRRRAAGAEREVEHMNQVSHDKPAGLLRHVTTMPTNEATINAPAKMFTAPAPFFTSAIDRSLKMPISEHRRDTAGRVTSGALA